MDVPCIRDRDALNNSVIDSLEYMDIQTCADTALRGVDIG